MNYFRELLQSRELLINLSLREIKGKYKRTIFGSSGRWRTRSRRWRSTPSCSPSSSASSPSPATRAAWTPSRCGCSAACWPWLFFSNVINAGAKSLVSNAALIQKVYFSRVVLPLSQVGALGFNWLFEMAVLIIALTIVGAFVWPWLPLVIVVMVLLAMFAAGVALILSIMNVYFRDTEHLLTIVLQIWMYLTPIIYPISLVETQSEAVGGLFGTPITVLGIYQANPMVQFVQVFRELLYDNRWPDGGAMLACALWAVGTFVVGLIIFRRSEKGLAEAL